MKTDWSVVGWLFRIIYWAPLIGSALGLLVLLMRSPQLLARSPLLVGLGILLNAAAAGLLFLTGFQPLSGTLYLGGQASLLAAHLKLTAAGDPEGRWVMLAFVLMLPAGCLLGLFFRT